MKKILQAFLCIYLSTYTNVTITAEVVNYQQKQVQINGFVVEKNGDPIIGANIIEKGTSNGVITDINGKFSLQVAEGSVIVISFIGYKKKELLSSDNMNQIIMEEDAAFLDEVVVVGYGIMKKSDLTGSVQHINADIFENQSNTNILNMLNSTVAGFFLTEQGTTAKGSGTMQIRGQTSIRAVNDPLVVVDGVIFQGSIHDINPKDIESIDILKDASSAAVFGARSASGVLIITTKKGLKGKPTIELSTKIGFVGVTKHLKPAGPDKYLQAKSDYRKRMNPNAPAHYYSNPNELPSDISVQQWLEYDPSNTGNAIETWLNRLNVSPIEQRNYFDGVVTDWYDDIFRHGLRQDYNVSISGGSEGLSYYWSNGYIKNQGISIGDDYNIFRSRLNLSADVTKFLKVGINSQFSNDDSSSTSVDLTSAIRMSPFTTRFDDNGDDKMYPNDDTLVQNPFLYYQYRDQINKTQSLFATLTADLFLPNGFSYKLAYANRFSWTKNYYFDPITTPNGLTNSGYGSRVNSSVYDYSIDNILKWNQTYANIHKFDVTLLANVEKYQSWSDTQTNSQFSPSDVLSYHALQGGVNPNLANNDEYSTGIALMARVNYLFNEKYLLTMSFRRDGYSAFGLNNPYSNFTSTAIGWNITEEKFFKKNLFDQLKLRISWGTNGNRDIGRYEALARLATTKYFYGNDLSIGVYTNTMANENLKWERTEALNFGIDFSFLKSRINGSVDYYDMTTRDLLLNRSLPRIIGYSSVSANLGELKNRGFELTVNSINLKKQIIEWSSTLTFSLNRNKIKHLYGEMVNIYDSEGNVIGKKESDDPTNSMFIGQALDRIWDYEVLGIYQLNEAEEAAKYGKQPGDIKLRDVNNDGKLIPNDDKIFQGYKTPRYRIGFRNNIRFLKNFELSFFIRADIDFYGVNNEYKNSATGGQFERTNWYDFPYWTPENQNNKWARLSSNFSSPSFDVYDNCTFVRLQEISLSYQLPKNITKRYSVENMRIFVNANNLFTITGLELWDPLSLSGPMPKITTFGLNLTL